MFDCQNLSFLAIGAAMLMLASSANVPKLMSRRDLRSVGTLILAAGVVMLLAKMCSPKKIAAAKYSLSPAPVSSEDDGAYSMDRELSSALLDTAKVSLECCDTSPYSTSTGCVCGAQEFVKEQNCMEGSIGSA
jgi:hypothetical protein